MRATPACLRLRFSCIPFGCPGLCSNSRKPFNLVARVSRLHAESSGLLPAQRHTHTDRIGQARLASTVARKCQADSKREVENSGMADISTVSKETLLNGQLCLCGVAILWGSYSPVIRYIYSCPGPPTPAALTAVRTVIQAAVLLLSNVVQQQRFTPEQKVKALQSFSAPEGSGKYKSYRPVLGSTLSWLSAVLHTTSTKLWIAGVELGFWNFCGSTFQALGLQYTSATRGAFLIQVYVK